MMCKDLFGGMFDFDMDGKTDSFELALGLCMLQEEEELIARATECDDNEIGAHDELAAAGLDRLSLSLMDDAERREALEDAGLDPDDFL